MIYVFTDMNGFPKMIITESSVFSSAHFLYSLKLLVLVTLKTGFAKIYIISPLILLFFLNMSLVEPVRV